MNSLPAASELNESGRIDGRAARGVRTRTAIADALYAILREGLDDTSARAIAERAGVSTRSVFQHFDDIEAVHAEVATREELAIRPFLEPIDPSVPLGERIDRLVAARDEMYAIIAPLRRAANKHRSTRTSSFIRANLTRLHRAQRDQIAATFSEEIAGDDRLALRIDVCLSFETWEQFIFQHGLTRADARGHLAGLMHSLLSS
ncbi:MAG: TetR/AcrR family transcriptional regulator [Ilumatobacteraceae bacterium]|nr:TetR/AcrR family transcriptional regulator [Ilumatobacteraceae bacterium]